MIPSLVGCCLSGEQGSYQPSGRKMNKNGPASGCQGCQSRQALSAMFADAVSLRPSPNHPEVLIAEQQLVQPVAQAVHAVGEDALLLGELREVDLGQALGVGIGTEVQ